MVVYTLWFPRCEVRTTENPTGALGHHRDCVRLEVPGLRKCPVAPCVYTAYLATRDQLDGARAIHCGPVEEITP